MNTQGTRQETEGTNAMYSHSPTDWQTRIVLLTPSGVERDGGPIISGDESPRYGNLTESAVTDTLISAGYSMWFTLPGLAVFTGDDAPQTHAYCACLALGQTPRVVAFERLADLTSFVSAWTPILEAVEDSYSGA